MRGSDLSSLGSSFPVIYCSVDKNIGELLILLLSGYEFAYGIEFSSSSIV